MELLQRERGERNSERLAESNAGAGDVVSLSEGNLVDIARTEGESGNESGGFVSEGMMRKVERRESATYTFANEILCQIRREHVGRQALLHLLREDGQRGNDALQDPQTLSNGISSVEHGFLRFLEILVVRGRKSFERCEETSELLQRSRRTRVSQSIQGSEARSGRDRTWPHVRPVFPRRSSRASGFFF